MTILVTTFKRDNIDETAMKKEFREFGWVWSGEGGIANKSYLFTWKGEGEPKFPEGYEYTKI